MTDSTTESVAYMIGKCETDWAALKASVSGLVARYEHAKYGEEAGIPEGILAMQLYDVRRTLERFCSYLETKYRAEEGVGKLHRPESFYAFAEGCYEDTPFRIEVDGPEESVVLHGILREIEGGLPNVSDTGYCYLSF